MRNRRVIALFFLAAGVALAAACSNDGVQAPEATTPAPASRFAIHIFSGPERARVDFVPAEVLPDSRPKVKPDFQIQGPDGSLPEDDAGARDVANAQSAWYLVWGAAAQCAPCDGGMNSCMPAVIPPWSAPGSWHVLSRTPTYCDEILASEEKLLCIADKLAEVADAVDTLTWDKVPTASESTRPELGGPWTIPPQSDRDRFIARDLAMNVLAHVARLDAMPLTLADGSAHTCAYVYANAAALGSADYQFIGGGAPSSLYPPPSFPLNPGTDWPALADARLGFEAHVLRAAGRLERELTEKSFYADLAAAEQSRAQAIDPQQGNAAAWGLQDPYGSLVHATRVVLGRWEMGYDPSHPPSYSLDPACGTGELELMNLYGDDREARLSDAPIVTSGQRIASKLIEREGIVIPLASIASATEDALKAAVVDQMGARVALQNGLSPSDPNALGEQGTAIQQMVAAISDADLRFALERALRTYALAVDGIETMSPVTPLAGLVAPPYVAPSLTALQGTAISGGIARDRLVADDVARAGSMMAASECDEPGGDDELLNADSISSWPSWVAAPQQEQRAAFQDAFSAGQALHRRLVVLHDEAIAASPDGTAGGVARDAMAELRSWAGPGRVTLRNSGDGQVIVETSGFTPGDWGVGSAAAMASQLSLVSGPAWVAECAARARDACPPNFEADYVARPISATVLAEGEAGFPRATFGIVNTYGSFAFDTSNLPDHFADTVRAPVYVIIDHDPKAKSSRGMVLGAIFTDRYMLASDAPRVTAGRNPFWTTHDTGFAVSTMQRDLLHALIGFADGKTELGGKTLGIGPEYCLPGVPRDLFVPLENELTADSDPYENSWRHYVTLAQQAATRADQLGQELIQLGLQQDLRREAAGEALANICGDESALGRVQVDPSGTVKPSPPDDVLNACLNEPTTPVVFLSKDQTIGLDANAKRTLLRSLLRCDQPGGTTNETCQDPNTQNLATGGLGIVPLNQGGPVLSCDDVVFSARTLKLALDGSRLGNALRAPWATPDGLYTAAHMISIEVDDQANWSVSAGGGRIMSSSDTALWPACLAQMTCKWNDPLVSTVSALYRSCPSAGMETTTPLGGCVAGASGDPARAELNAILWRVQGSAWLLGAISGGVPAGMFKIPVPVADYAIGSWPSQGAPTATVYLTSQFHANADGTYTLLAPPEQLDEQRAMGLVTGMGPAFGAWPGSPSNEMPQMVVGVYQNPTQYHLAHATSGEWTPQYWSLPDYFGQETNFHGWTDRTTVPADALGVLVAGMDGLGCPAPYGAPTIRSKWAPVSVFGVIGALKTEALPLGGPQVWYEFNTRHWHVAYATGDDPLTGRLASWELGLDGVAWDQLPMMLRDDGNLNFVPYPDGQTAPLPAGYWGPADPTTSPDRRVAAFANGGIPNGACGAATQLVQSFGLACVAAQAGTGAPALPQPPALQSVEDIAKLESWLGSMATLTRTQASTIVIENVPTRVVDDFAKGQVGSGSNKGQHGQTVLKIEQDVQSLASSWLRIATDLESLQASVGTARLAIERADIQQHRELLQQSMARFRAIADMAAQVGSIVTLKGALGGWITGLANAAGDASELIILSKLDETSDDEHANAVAMALNQLQAQVIPLSSDMDKAFDDLRASAAGTMADISSLSNLEQTATYEAAKGSGQDYVMIDGHPVMLPVNTVLRREYDATRLRYEQALADARELAFLARRAIEQRIGVTLDAIATPVGALPPPASWADDVCHLTGIDYQTLSRSATGPDADAGPDSGADRAVSQQFADQFVGDYVAKLQSFVEYYNVQYPSHDGDDTAILSLKDDLLPPSRSCIVDAPNLLYYSDTLAVTAPAPTLAADEHRWQLTGCTDSKCLRAEPATALALPNDPPDAAAHGDATWLRDVAPSGAAAASNPTPIPPASLGQAVSLTPGSYVLSWWDQARAPDGSWPSSTSGPPVPFRVVVVASDGHPLASYSDVPFVGGAGVMWGPRHTLTFDLPTPDTIFVTFAASESPADLGSVAIADVQLEKSPAGASAGPYVATGQSRSVFANQCHTHTPDELRAAFQRQCDDGGNCYYEMRAPFLLDTGALGTPTSTLSGKLATGNFNFRHISVYVNLVGTGVHDCTDDPTPSCYGSGFSEYTLEHDSAYAGIKDWNGDVRLFDFGTGVIEHGKALAAERYVTLPISANDQQLLTQPGIEKPELRGRPLDGNYRLRIWDSPALHWNRLQDVQLILKYRYWSRIQREPQGQ